MKQALYRKGIVYPIDVPVPSIKPGFVKIRVCYSCVSAGTELGGVQGSKKSLLKRAIDAPEKVISTLHHIQSNGLSSTIKKLNNLTESFKSSGYSVAGVIEEVGAGVNSLKKGDRVTGSGANYAVHAEFVVVPKSLVTPIPLDVSFDNATVATVGAIALHGVRRAELAIGDYVVVVGSGLIGLLTVQLLNNSGVRVACVDINSSRLAKATINGAELALNSENEDVVNAIMNWTNGYGADAVIFTASTKSDEPLKRALMMLRKKGKLVMVGVSGMTLDREEMYLKEIDFLISTSYGPGRYDNKYELDGVDYPYHYVRWTQGRNIAEFLRLLSSKKIDLSKIGPKVFPIHAVGEAFQLLEMDPDNSILVIIEYPMNKSDQITFNVEATPKKIKSESKKVVVGLIGAGSFATNRLLPILQELNEQYTVKTIVDRNGTKVLEVAKNFSAMRASTDVAEIFGDPEIDLVVICTQHGNHAELALKALRAGKHVFVEKPLATTIMDVNAIEEFYKVGESNPQPVLMVGFNRRFSKYLEEIKKFTDKRIGPLYITYRMNAGYEPVDSNLHKDGGRIVGEACHVIDLMHYLTDSVVNEFNVSTLYPQNSKYFSDDNRSISLSFKDGSLAVINYFSVGHPKIAKERLEVHFDGKSIELLDYRQLVGFGMNIRSMSSKNSNKGHFDEWLSLYESLTGINAKWPISLANLLDTSRISILAAQQISQDVE